MAAIGVDRSAEDPLREPWQLWQQKKYDAALDVVLSQLRTVSADLQPSAALGGRAKAAATDVFKAPAQATYLQLESGGSAPSRPRRWGSSPPAPDREASEAAVAERFALLGVECCNRLVDRRLRKGDYQGALSLSATSEQLCENDAWPDRWRVDYAWATARFERLFRAAEAYRVAGKAGRAPGCRMQTAGEEDTVDEAPGADVDFDGVMKDKDLRYMRRSLSCLEECEAMMDRRPDCTSNPESLHTCLAETRWRLRQDIPSAKRSCRRALAILAPAAQPSNKEGLAKAYAAVFALWVFHSIAFFESNWREVHAALRHARQIVRRFGAKASDGTRSHRRLLRRMERASGAAPPLPCPDQDVDVLGLNAPSLCPSPCRSPCRAPPPRDEVQAAPPPPSFKEQHLHHQLDQEEHQRRTEREEQQDALRQLLEESVIQQRELKRQLELAEQQRAELDRQKEQEWLALLAQQRQQLGASLQAQSSAERPRQEEAVPPPRLASPSPPAAVPSCEAAVHAHSEDAPSTRPGHGDVMSTAEACSVLDRAPLQAGKLERDPSCEKSLASYVSESSVEAAAVAKAAFAGFQIPSTQPSAQPSPILPAAQVADRPPAADMAVQAEAETLPAPGEEFASAPAAAAETLPAPSEAANGVEMCTQTELADVPTLSVGSPLPRQQPRRAAVAVGPSTDDLDGTIGAFLGQVQEETSKPPLPPKPSTCTVGTSCDGLLMEQAEESPEILDFLAGVESGLLQNALASSCRSATASASKRNGRHAQTESQSSPGALGSLLQDALPGSGGSQDEPLEREFLSALAEATASKNCGSATSAPVCMQQAHGGLVVSVHVSPCGVAAPQSAGAMPMLFMAAPTQPAATMVAQPAAVPAVSATTASVTEGVAPEQAPATAPVTLSLAIDCSASQAETLAAASVASQPAAAAAAPEAPLQLPESAPGGERALPRRWPSGGPSSCPTLPRLSAGHGASHSVSFPAAALTCPPRQAPDSPALPPPAPVTTAPPAMPVGGGYAAAPSLQQTLRSPRPERLSSPRGLRLEVSRARELAAASAVDAAEPGAKAVAAAGQSVERMCLDAEQQPPQQQETQEEMHDAIGMNQAACRYACSGSAGAAYSRADVAMPAASAPVKRPTVTPPVEVRQAPKQVPQAPPKPPAGRPKARPASVSAGAASTRRAAATSSAKRTSSASKAAHKMLPPGAAAVVAALEEGGDVAEACNQAGVSAAGALAWAFRGIKAQAEPAHIHYGIFDWPGRHFASADAV
eukprot:TRINITY_DN9931_c0_g1_i2.p1 TRINITY_DN9931_c0_g1~~TRINITY_DN9931_c0_g1_i2.p1  ORF type:complete len:1262 (+),score=298.34 TRINITY_DN9931_c0_g1_i2:48-3833(+)